MSGIVFTESSGLQDSIYGKSQAPIRMFIEKKGEGFEAKSTLPDLFAMNKSRHWGEKFTTMTAMNGFQAVGENGEYPNDNMQEGFSKFLEHMTWKDSFKISREMIEDSKAVDLKQKPQSFVAGYYRTREKFGHALYGAAVSGKSKVTFAGKEFDTTCADGLCLFAKTHPSKVNAKNVQSNLFADAFSVDALSAIETAMQNFTGDNGEILDVAPDTIVIPNEFTLKKAVFAAVGADKDPATANNGFNYQFGRWTIIISSYLNPYLASGAKPFILLDSKYNEDKVGAVWLDRTELEVRSEIASNDANIWKGYARFIAGFNDWRFAAVGGVSGGTALISG